MALLRSKNKKTSKEHRSMFSRGYEASREEKNRQDKARESGGKRLFEFFLTEDGDEAQVRFLTEEPVNFYGHNVQEMRGGKKRFSMYVCTQDDKCPFCANGDRPSFRAAFLIYDKREFDIQDRKTGKKKTVSGQIRLYTQGVRAISQLDRISSRYHGLTKCDIIIARVGKGQNTSYSFDRVPEEDEKITAKEIKKLLPDKLSEEFDGTEDSLYSIIEEQLEMMIPDSDSADSDEDEEDSRPKRRYDDDEDEDDDEEYERRRRRNLISGSKHRDNDDEDEEEDDDDGRTSRSKKKSRTSGGGLRKPTSKSEKRRSIFRK